MAAREYEWNVGRQFGVRILAAPYFGKTPAARKKGTSETWTSQQILQSFAQNMAVFLV
jgi:hypothetical protein